MPDITDYTPIISGGWAGPAVVSDFNTLFSTDLNAGPDGDVALFKAYLQAGKTYKIGCETSFSQGSFDELDIALLYWKPSDWPGSLIYPFTPTYENYTDEDAGPYWLPYNYKLNFDDFGNWVGGRRTTIIADETGDWYFLFFKPKPPLIADFMGWPTSGSAPLIVDFWDFSSGDPTGWEWDFGDGTPKVYDNPFPWHEYTIPNTYNVTLKITRNGDEATEIKENYITVFP